MKKIIKAIASVFYLGYVPLMPGTAASLAAVVPYLLFGGNLYLYSVILAAVCVAGFLVCGPAEKAFAEKDPSRVVIDEVAGMLLSFWGLQLSPFWIVTGFFMFRAFDMLKPYPANRIEKLHGSLGIMGDDLIAGIYTNIILRLLC